MIIAIISEKESMLFTLSWEVSFDCPPNLALNKKDIAENERALPQIVYARRIRNPG